MFRGTDMVGNPFSLSEKFNLKIDTSPVHFGGFSPGEDDFADQRKVECFIQILDEGSGVDPSTVEYSMAKSGSDDKNFGPWKKVVNVVVGNPTQVLLELEFEWGTDNYVRWRANDLMGTGENISKPYRVWVNSQPEVVISSPDPGSYFRFDGEITFDASDSSDEDGDNLSYYWSSNVTKNRSIGSMAFMSANLVPGKHSITLFVSDGHGYNESTKVKIEVGSRALYERDSDGDGFSDGLEREKGTDSHNGADFPEGEADMKDAERAGILADGSSLFFIILGSIFLLIILILVVLFIVKKMKKTEENETSPSFQPAMQPSQYGPTQHPYPQGQYLPSWQLGYGEMAQYQQAVAGMPVAGPPHLMLPPGPGMASPQQYDPGHAQQAQLPLYDPSQQEVTYGQLGTGVASSTAYSLPLFSTDQGQQDLERMALPPGPAPQGEPTMISPATPPPTSIQDVSVQPAALSDVFNMETTSPTPPAPLSSSGEIPQVPPAQIPFSPQSPPLFEPGTPPVPEESSVPVTNEITMNDPQTGPWVSSSVPADRIAPLHPSQTSLLQDKAETASPSIPPPNGDHRSGFQRMQCHSCGNNYVAEIKQLPALVTCTICQTQGVIESL